ncbi:hypothetical protein PISMIDRAFT_15172 [Pisolithus microcarpus 441]|uniref:Uncharacterized protein n=1 Tax=Pisolithus microcarpus 441 TaxID=765257 RepID=A0A0C9Z4F8_9AGAM|nr:hypothetical protein PISMIDRAFT_15172 [Pisolithus microcarpus 441]
MALSVFPDVLHLDFHLATIEGGALELPEANEGGLIGTQLSHWLVQTTELFGILHSTIASYWDRIWNCYFSHVKS